jgi:hypothetical protein
MHFVYIVAVVSVQDPNSMDAEEGPVSLLQAQVGVERGALYRINMLYSIGHASYYQKSLVHYRVYLVRIVKSFVFCDLLKRNLFSNVNFFLHVRLKYRYRSTLICFLLICRHDSLTDLIMDFRNISL